MSKTQKKYDEDFKKKDVKLSYVTPKTAKDFAADFGINSSLIYRLRRTYNEQGEKTKVAEQEDVFRWFQLENAELKMENEMLKKATFFSGWQIG